MDLAEVTGVGNRGKGSGEGSLPNVAVGSLESNEAQLANWESGGLGLEMCTPEGC